MHLSSLYGRLLQLGYGTFTPPVHMSYLMHEHRHPIHILCLVKNNQCAQNIIWGSKCHFNSNAIKGSPSQTKQVRFCCWYQPLHTGRNKQTKKKQSSFTHKKHMSWIDLLCHERYVRDGELSGGWASVLLVAFRLSLDILAFVEHSWQRMKHVKRWLSEFRH